MLPLFLSARVVVGLTARIVVVLFSFFLCRRGNGGGTLGCALRANLRFVLREPFSFARSSHFFIGVHQHRVGREGWRRRREQFGPHRCHFGRAGNSWMAHDALAGRRQGYFNVVH